MNAWSINTNIKNNADSWDEMISQNKISAYYGKGKTLERINESDLILLYHNNNRFIAVGIAVSRAKSPSHIPQGSPSSGLEEFVNVKWLWKTRNTDNSIIRQDVGITTKRHIHTLIDITDRLDYKKLFTEIAKKQLK